ncbi:MAG: hypothetical protein LCI00_12700 [Chloroflexi bacterium]|nr:hypothetical protein [Chloroflexota bacterium]MCC6891978.1 hypothetical protein [Anaerolineae bacterium]
MTDFMSKTLLAQIDMQRTSRGFMSVTELLETLGSEANIILDPFSTLVSKDVKIGSGNIFYPNVIIEIQNEGTISIGSNNVFFPGALLLADRGKITIGDGNEFGDGGVSIKANMPDALIEIGNKGRYMHSPEIMGRCQLESGTQIIGMIRVQNCNLEAGDSYKEPDAETRGGLLKGFGVARNLTVHQGEVINGQGNFEQDQIEQQSVYHPKKT